MNFSISVIMNLPESSIPDQDPVESLKVRKPKEDKNLDDLLSNIQKARVHSHSLNKVIKLMRN